MRSDVRIHHISTGDLPEKFTYPFCYTPVPAVTEAAETVIRHIDGSEDLKERFGEGKMLGVLIVEDRSGKYGFLAGFSGNAGGSNDIPYFVPPVFDLLAPEGHFKKEEAYISGLNAEIDGLLHSEEYRRLKEKIRILSESKGKSVGEWRKKMTESKAERDSVRRSTADPEVIAALIKESQFEKAELKRIKAVWDTEIAAAKQSAGAIEDNIRLLSEQRQEQSDNLQKWISGHFTLNNAKGESKSVSDIFREEGMTPPAGTGECAAPKMLQYAYIHGLRPIAMGEFWYGRTAGTSEVRSHGHFYPSCTGKCGPLLRFMLQGLDVEDNPMTSSGAMTPYPYHGIDIIYEDDCLIAVNKPSGMLSVPGKTGKVSLAEHIAATGREVLAVHRLDMDTSGVIVFAKDRHVQKELQRQFASHEPRKTYMAILDMTGSGRMLQAGEKGVISLPLSPDYEERPRQKVDHAEGKEAVTEYEIMSVSDKTASVRFHPITGRTHQLRVHSAHPEGIGYPIKGDRLYGSGHDGSHDRLCLHAESLVIKHPVSGKDLVLRSRLENLSYFCRSVPAAIRFRSCL